MLWNVCEGEYLSAEKCLRKHTRLVKLASLGSVLCLDNFLSFSHYFNTGIDLRRIKEVSKFKSFVTFLNIAIIIIFFITMYNFYGFLVS